MNLIRRINDELYVEASVKDVRYMKFNKLHIIKNGYSIESDNVSHMLFLKRLLTSFLKGILNVSMKYKLDELEVSTWWLAKDDNSNYRQYYLVVKYGRVLVLIDKNSAAELLEVLNETIHPTMKYNDKTRFEGYSLKSININDIPINNNFEEDIDYVHFNVFDQKNVYQKFLEEDFFFSPFDGIENE